MARATIEPEKMFGAIRTQVAALDPEIPIFDVKTLEEHIAHHSLRAKEPNEQIELPQRLWAQEKKMIGEALKESRGRVFGPTGAAAKLGTPRSTLESRLSR